MQCINSRRTSGIVSVMLVAALTATACSSSAESTSSSGSATVDVAAAQAIVDPYLGAPSGFPVTEPLKELPPAGSTLVFVGTGTPVSALFFSLLKPATDALGIELSQIEAGTSAQDVSAAMDSVVSSKPDGIIVIGVDPRLFTKQLEQLRDAGTITIGVGVANGDEQGFETVQFGDAQQERAGELMAAYALSSSDGEATELAIYTVPELAFLKPMVEAAKETIDELCDGCTVRVVDVPVTQLGNTAPQTVVADLQANPGTGFALFATDEIENGLPAALKVAGIEVPTIGDGPGASNLQAIIDGEQTAGVGTDLAVVSWTAVDQFARELAGQPLVGDQKEGLSPEQILLQDDLAGKDVSKGWVSYPDFQERFKKLWAVS